MYIFKIHLSNGQLDNLAYDQRERVYSESSTDHINFNRTNPFYLSRYRNSCWFRCRTSSSSSNEYNSTSFNDKISSLNSSTAYARLKRFTERLLELERKARQTDFENKFDPKVLSTTDKSISKVDRSFNKNDNQIPSNFTDQSFAKRSFHVPTQTTLNIKYENLLK